MLTIALLTRLGGDAIAERTVTQGTYSIAMSIFTAKAIQAKMR